MKQAFQDGFGTTVVVLEYHERENYLSAEFIGIQTIGVFEQVAEFMYCIFKDKACCKYLSDNSRMVGGKDFANDFILDKFLPNAIKNGLKYIAYVVAPVVSNLQTIENLHLVLPKAIEFMLFDKVEDGRYWLLQK